MPLLKLAVEKLEDIPEAVRGYYKQGQDGKFVLDAELPTSAGSEDVANLKTALAKEREDRRKAREDLEKFRDQNGNLLDAERAKAALLETQKAEEEKAKAAGKWEELKQQMAEKHKSELKKLEDTTAKTHRMLEKLVVDEAATRAISAAGGKVKVLAPLIRQHLKMVEEDGEPRAVVVDAKGDPRIGDAKGNPMTIEQLVEEFKNDPDYGANFQSSGATGSGAPTRKAEGPGAGRAGAKSVSINDQAGLNDNLEAIAKGLVTVGE